MEVVEEFLAWLREWLCKLRTDINSRFCGLFAWLRQRLRLRLRLCPHLRLRQLTKQQIRRGTLAFFALFLPVYVFLGLQPAPSAEASHYPTLSISSIDLETPVEPLQLEGSTLTAPTDIAGSFSLYTSPTLIIGHSATVFARLEQAALGAEITYDDATYVLVDRQILPKEQINMNQLLARRTTDTLILMTCAGQPLGGQDYTHRLILTAEKAESESTSTSAERMEMAKGGDAKDVKNADAKETEPESTSAKEAEPGSVVAERSGGTE